MRTTHSPAVMSLDPAVGGRWRMDLGATVLPRGVRFRVWAPKCRRVDVVIDDQMRPLDAQGDGYFDGVIAEAGAGTLYRYRLDGGRAYPDPCSRAQPRGPHGPSLVVDPAAYEWGDADWAGVSLRGQVFYELHVGAFTPEGTFDAAARELPELAALGVTVVELMPLAECPGRWNWGYDGVGLFAPAHVYGDPDAVRRFVDTAHGLGLGVILDVVYNHFGPDGNYWSAFSEHILTDRYATEWGQAIDFDGPHSAPVRECIIANACYWITEYHVDGLRLDATHRIQDASGRHILAELSERVRAAAAPRRVILIAENESQDVRCVAPIEQGGYGLDAIWSDDFHHSVRVALTGRQEAYYTDYRGAPQELLSCVKRGFLYQGQRYEWQDKARGTPVTNEPAPAFVFFMQNHDQVANHVRGERLHVAAAAGPLRAMTAFWLLAPQTPLLFMGQEFAASSPFFYFADHRDGLARAVRQGREEFLAQFPSYATPDARRSVPDPADEGTFRRSKLDQGERVRHGAAYRLHQDLLRIRRDDPVIAAQNRDLIDGAVLGPSALVLRFSDPRHGDRLLVVNAGTALDYRPAPEPLLAPLQGRRWRMAWSSDAVEYGGPGPVNPLTEAGWRLPGGNATFFTAEPI